MRRWLWRPLPADTILDDVMAPMRIVLAGFRVVFDDQAHAFDLAVPHAATELRRKSRTLAGNFQLLAREPRLLVPILNPYAAIHVAQGGAPGVAVRNHRHSGHQQRARRERLPLLSGVVGGQVAFYALAGYGALLERRARRHARW